MMSENTKIDKKLCQEYRNSSHLERFIDRTTSVLSVTRKGAEKYSG